MKEKNFSNLLPPTFCARKNLPGHSKTLSDWLSDWFSDWCPIFFGLLDFLQRLRLSDWFSHCIWDWKKNSSWIFLLKRKNFSNSLPCGVPPSLQPSAPEKIFLARLKYFRTGFPTGFRIGFHFWGECRVSYGLCNFQCRVSSFQTAFWTGTEILNLTRAVYVMFRLQKHNSGRLLHGT